MSFRWAVRRSADECRRVQGTAGRGRCKQFGTRAEEQRAAVPSKGTYPEEAGSWPERRESPETMLWDYKPIEL